MDKNDCRQWKKSQVIMMAFLFGGFFTGRVVFELGSADMPADSNLRSILCISSGGVIAYLPYYLYKKYKRK